MSQYTTIHVHYKSSPGLQQQLFCYPKLVDKFHLRKQVHDRPWPTFIRRIYQNSYQCEHMAEPWQAIWPTMPTAMQMALMSNGYTNDTADARLFSISFRRQEQGYQTPILQVADDAHKNSNAARNLPEDRPPSTQEAEAIWAQ